MGATTAWNERREIIETWIVLRGREAGVWLLCFRTLIKHQAEQNSQACADSDSNGNTLERNAEGDANRDPNDDSKR